MAETEPQKTITFIWEGKNKQGMVLTGEINALERRFAEGELRAQGIEVTRIKKKAKALVIFKPKIKPINIIIFTRNLATMLNAGLPIIRAFDILAKGEDHPAMRGLLQEIKKEIESGNSLESALKKHPKHFDNLYCGLVATGEQSGTLTEMLQRLTIYLERSYYLKKKVKKAMVYPAIVISVALGVSSILLIFVVPKFQEMFKSFGADLPMFTQIVVNISNFLRKRWWIIVLVTVGVTWWFRRKLKQSQKFSARVDNILFRLKIVGPLMKKIIIARFSRVLATTLASGMPMMASLQAAVHITKPGRFQNAILQIKDRVEAGEQLHLAMEETRLFPNLVIQMVAVGEESGSLDAMLTKIAMYYEDEVDTVVDNLNALLEPLIILVLGTIIGGLVAAMYLPIFRLGTVM